MSSQRRFFLALSLLLLTFCKFGITAEPGPIYYFDISETVHFDRANPAAVRAFWDTQHLVASVQGIVNRERETLFVRTKASPDDFWWDELRKDGNWLSGRPVVKIGSLDELLRTFETQLQGTVVYGEKPWSLSNVASTVAGVESRACLRFDASPESLYQKTLRSGLAFAAPENAIFLCDPNDGGPLCSGEKGKPLPLITEFDRTAPPLLSCGSAKCDAYLWAKRNYLDTGRVAKKDMAYYLDSYWLGMPEGDPWNNTVINHDFCIARGGFFFELHCWDDETPLDDPDQPLGTDLATTKAILKTMYGHAGGEIFSIHGFTPWAWKYTSHGKAGSKHDPVATEWETVRIFSAYNAIIDADALGLSSLANASFYQHFPLKDFYPQPKRPSLETLREQKLIDENGRVAPKTYVMFYMGDYDSAAWLGSWVPQLWEDPARGTIPCNWAFNPNLDQRVPHVMHYVRTHAKENDWFITGDSGAGYLNPGMLTSPRLDPEIPDGWDAWVKHCTEYYKKYDLDITGFVIDGYAPPMGDKGLKAYSKFSPAGLIGHIAKSRGVFYGMPVIPMRHDLYGEPPQAGKELAEAFVATRQEGKPLFLPVRTILKTPSWHKGVMQEVETRCGAENVRFVDAYTFFLLLKAECEAPKP